MNSYSLETTTCFHMPTRTLLVDDDYTLLVNIARRLDTILPIEFHTDISAVMTKINDSIAYQTSIDSYINSFKQVFSDEHTFDYIADLSFLSEMQRYQQLSIIVTDYDMPRISGENLLRTLPEEFNAQRIMLTGRVHDQYAIDLLNESIVHQFISKVRMHRSMSDELLQCFSRLRKRYFMPAMNKILARMPESLSKLLTDKSFIRLFADYQEKHNICEFYLLDQYGSFFMLSEYGDPHWFLLKPHSVIDDYCRTFIENELINENKVEEIKQHKLLPFIIEQCCDDIDFSKEDDFLFPAQELQTGEQIYAYCFLNYIPSYFHVLDELKSLDDYRLTKR